MQVHADTTPHVVPKAPAVKRDVCLPSDTLISHRLSDLVKLCISGADIQDLFPGKTGVIEPISTGIPAIPPVKTRLHLSIQNPWTKYIHTCTHTHFHDRFDISCPRQSGSQRSSHCSNHTKMEQVCINLESKTSPATNVSTLRANELTCCN
jgi:hypothetical protein